MVPIAGFGLAAKGQLGGFVDFVQRPVPLAMYADAHGNGLIGGVARRKPQAKGTLAHRRQIRAAESHALRRRVKGGDPVMRAAPHRRKHCLFAVYRQAGGNERLVAAQL